MYFKRIEMQGFKSFAEPVSIEFHDGITCIVGPNGSGKSNISDAIRWVLGEQSPKMLRGGKMEEVIFSGTATRKSRGMAEVTLVIDNSSGILPIDFAEVAITRRMFRSGESEYFINRVPCRLRDIRELIMDTGIGVDGYSLIGQGKIAEIVSSKPESRREIFEEAAGIVKYRAKKQEAERKLEASRGNLERVADIIGELESRIDGLREDSEKAREYLGLRDRYKTNEINIILKSVETLELKNEYLKDDLTEQRHRIDQHKQEKEALDRAIAAHRSRADELEQTEKETGDRLLALIDEINRLTGQNQLRDERLQSLEANRERLRDEIRVLAAKRDQETANGKALEANGRELTEKLERIRIRLADETARLSAALAASDAASRTADESKDKIYELHSRMVAARSEASSLGNLLAALERRQEEIRAEGGGAADQEKNLSAAVAQADADRTQLAKTLEAQEREAAARAAMLRERQDKERALRDAIAAGVLEYEKAAARRRTIEEMERAYEGYNYGVRHLMKRKLPGLCGVVGELVSVPEGYETAIETALGAALQNVVCKTEADASQAIEMLKRDKAGRLTFLPLSRIRPVASTRDPKVEAGVGFLGYADKIAGCADEYKPVFGYLLGRVAVVDRLDHAVALARNSGSGLRFVTLEGDVINAAGAMTGGSFQTNTAGLLERKTEAARLSQAMEQLQATVEDQRSEAAELLAAIEAGLAEAAAAEQEKRTAERSLLTRENELVSLRQQWEALRETIAKQDRSLDDSCRKAEETRVQIRSLEEAAAVLEADVRAAEAAAEAAIRTWDEQKAEREAQSEAVTRIRLEEAAAAAELSNLEQLHGRVKAYIREQEEAAAARESALAALDLEEAALRGDRQGETTDLDGKEAAKHETEVLWERIREERIRAARQAEELQKEKDGMDEGLLGLQTARQELEWKLERNETQVEGYKERLWEEFETSYVQAMDFRSQEFSMAAAQRENREIRGRMRELGEVNVGAIKEYESVGERLEFLTGQRGDLLAAMGSLVSIIEDMDRTIRRSFSETFEEVAGHFGEAFRALFGGGNAELRLEDPSRPLETGIEIVAQPPGKKLQNINLMSGGEKTMTAIALMFAVLKTKPTPFCILDEVEAALDDSNIDRFIRYLKDLEEIQFTLVTHQKATMEYADVLYGVTMPEQGVSRVISLKLGDPFEL